MRRFGAVLPAVDTNLIVRYLTRDHAGQFARAAAIIEAGPAWVATTVLLETEWVLRKAYAFSVDQILVALRRLAGLPTVQLEAPEVAAQAFDWCEAGMDFADALHLAAAQGRGGFLTFDARMIRAAKRAGAAQVAAP